MPSSSVLRDLGADGVLLLTWNRPGRKNAFDNAMWNAARDALRDAMTDDAVRAVVVTGAGAAFTAGADLGEMAMPSLGEGQEHGFGAFMDALCDFDKPLVAAVNGVGVGIGLTILLHCDVVFIAEGARLRPPFVELGVVPEAASSYLLPVHLGWHRAAEVLYTADWIDAARAVALGLATYLCRPERVLADARALAARIAAQPPGAVRHTKRLLLATRAEQIRAARAREDAAFLERVGSEENLAAIQAFFARRSKRSDGA